MKKLAMSLVTLSMLVSSAAWAGPPRTPRVDHRQVNQQARIVQGVKSGELTKREAARLEVGQAHVANVEHKAKADGNVTPAERARIEAAQNRQSRRIYAEKHDAQTKR
ncbi:MAG: hypothetical protein U1E65_17755 [Myxococcota bacterium]